MVIVSGARILNQSWKLMTTVRILDGKYRMRCTAFLLAALSIAGCCLAAASAAEQDGWREIVRQFAVQHFKNPAWGYSHSVRDYQLAKELAESDHVTVDDDVLFAAAYLHDIAAFAPWDREKEGVDHADEGARIVDTILKGTGFPPNKIDAVRGAIRTHMFDRIPVGPEALYLHDADALDWLGAIGAARVMALVDPNGGPPDGPKAAKMLEDNLARVPPHVLSPSGKQRLPDLQRELAEFLKNLRRETEDYREL
ncbi:MAG: HD domain-containing protein [Proteobacteria bacterium]|nr:HD domain-containing protein [Pseudomonadota bacterium]